MEGEDWDRAMQWRAIADEIHADICANGVDGRGVFTQYYGTDALDAPPARLGMEPILREARERELCVIHTSTPSFASDVKVAAQLKEVNPSLLIGFVGFLAGR